VTERLLRVIAPQFIAGAVWVKENNQWACSNRVAPIIKWMRYKTPDQVVRYLRKKGWEWQWL
jgi:hypothetical protein